MKNPLTIFLEKYWESENLEESCIYAGYGIEMLPKLLKDPMISSEIGKISREIEQDFLGTRKEKLGVGKLSRVERELLLSEIARDSGENSTTRIKAIELLGKAEGDYVIRSEVVVSGGNYSSLSTEQLEELLDRLRNRLGSEEAEILRIEQMN